MAKKLFEYDPFIKYKGEVTEENGKRQYESVCGLKAASTTTVLSAYEDKDFLEVWKEKKIAEGENPDAISEESARVGSRSHEYIESYLIDGVYPLGNLVEQKLACVAIDNFYSHVDPENSQCEQPLFYDGRLQKNPEPFALAGRYDNLCALSPDKFQVVKTGEVLDFQYVVCDLKTKRSYDKNPKTGKVKLKSLGRTDKCDFMFKNCLQISFYSACLSLQTDFKERYGAGVTGGVLVYVNEEQSKLMYLDRKDLNYYWRVFKEILRDFYGIKKLERSWSELISHANGRYDYGTGRWVNNIPKEILVVKN
jgi:hypothetical protein